MHRPGAFDGLLKWTLTGLASGTTFVASAAASDPSAKALSEIAAVTPDLRTSTMILLMSVFTYLLRQDNAKITTSTGTAIGEQQKTLLDKIEGLAFETRKSSHDAQLETNRFRVDMAEKIGGIQATVNDIRVHQGDMGRKIDTIETRVYAVETNCAVITGLGGHKTPKGHP